VVFFAVARTLRAMQQVVFLVVAVAVSVVIFKLRGDAARERKAVMARLDAERQERGDYSPTAELFREAGINTDTAPPPAPARSVLREHHPGGALAGQNEVGSDAGGDLRALFKGISMPAGLKPLGPLAPVSANFVTSAAPSEVHAGLEAEFARLACEARWVEPTVAQTERNGMRGLVTIYPNPTAALDLDGNPLFPEVEAGQVVVRMLAL